MKKRFGLGSKITGLIAIVQIIIMTVLVIFIYSSLNTALEDNATNNLQTVAMDRSKLIENYMIEVEEVLTLYSQAGEVNNVISNPEDEAIRAEGQAYTERFSKNVAYMEGIYSSTWETKILIHTNPATFGLVTRKDEAPRKALHDAMLATDGVYNTGIIISPASGAQIISMYRAFYDEGGNPIGLTGCGIYTEGLKEMLNSLTIKGMEKAKYYLVNVNTGEYIFHEDFEKIATVSDESHIITLVNNVKSGSANNGTIHYEQNGEEYIAAYESMPERGWVFVLTDPASEAFAVLSQLSSRVIILCIGGIVILLVMTYLFVTLLLKSLKGVIKSVNRLKNLEINKDENLALYEKRRDEVGDIAQAVRKLMQALMKISETLRNSSNSLKNKSNDLFSHSNRLVDSVSDNTATTEELSASLTNTNSIVEDIHESTDSINSKVLDIVEHLENSTKLSNQMAQNSAEMKEMAQSTYTNSQKKYDQTKVSVKSAMERLNEITKINAMTENILDISSQTNLLSINASIEAARAGENGRGFAVVAEQIAKLSETTAESVNSIQAICNQANESIQIVNNCFEDILSFIEMSVMEGFHNLTLRTEECTVASSEVKDEILNVHNSTHLLQQSVQSIAENLANVRNITEENEKAIGAIIEKNDDTLVVAEDIRGQSNENKELSDQLEEVVQQFQV